MTPSAPLSIGNERSFVRTLPRPVGGAPSQRRREGAAATPRIWRQGQASQLAFRFRPGQGQPVVGLHGLGSVGGDLEAVGAALPGVPMALVDLPGFGASPGPLCGLSGAVTAVLSVLDALGWERPVWLGCSFGGHVALRAALDAPWRVGALVLADSGGLDPDPNPALRDAFSEAVLRGRAPGDVARSLDALVARPTALTRAFHARRLAAHAAGADYAGVAEAACAALDDDAGRRLHEVTAPVELVHGERDALVPLAMARSAELRMPRARLTVLPGVGHMPWLEAPAEVAARVARARARSARTTPSTTGDM